MRQLRADPDTSTTCATMLLNAVPMAMPRAVLRAGFVLQPAPLAAASSTASQRGLVSRARRNS